MPVSRRRPSSTSQTGSRWDVAGRAVEGELKGYTLAWVDSVQAKWFAWSAEYPHTTVYTAEQPPGGGLHKPAPARPAALHASATEKEIAGTSEFLRLLPKPFATLQAIDLKNRTVTLLIEGEKTAKVWPVEPDAELKVAGWWGRPEQFRPGERVWVWLKLDRKKEPISIVMLADEASERDIHGTANKPAEGLAAQKAWLEKRWVEAGLPGTLTFHHLFSGELEFTLDHEAMRWARSLKSGDVVHLTADPPIKGVVKSVTPWRERTVIRMVVGELEASELKIGQRLCLKMQPPPETVEGQPVPAGHRPATNAGGARRVVPGEHLLHVWSEQQHLHG